jgi:hypothetical protein
MGSIAGALFTVPAYRYLVSDAAGQLTIPFWIVLLAHAAIGLGTPIRRLAHCSYDGIENHLVATGGRICCRSRRRRDTIRSGTLRRAGIHDSHHHGRHRWSELPETSALSALERCRQDRLGMDFDNPRIRLIASFVGWR